MGQLLLINPSKRKKKMAKRRTAAQRRATKKLISFNKGRKTLNRKRSTRKRNPAPARRRRSIAVAAPARRRRRVVARMSNPRKRSRVRTNIIMKTLPVAATSAVGALGLDILMGYAAQWLPANLTTGPMNSVVKAIGAIGLGMAVEKVTNKRTAEQVIVGGLTVTMHSLLKDLVATNAPQIPLGVYDGLGYYTPGLVAKGGVDGMSPMGTYSERNTA